MTTGLLGICHIGQQRGDRDWLHSMARCLGALRDVSIYYILYKDDTTRLSHSEDFPSSYMMVW